MSRPRFATAVATLSLSAMLFGACSAESLTERAMDFGLEQAIEAQGDDVDVDFDLANGGFRVSTEEGDFALQFDEENGGIVFETDEGSGIVKIDDNGIAYDTDEGSGTIGFDRNGITYDTDEGSGTIGIDLSDLDGVKDSLGAGLSAGGSVPDGWPPFIGLPETFRQDESFFHVIDEGGLSLRTGVITHDPRENFAAAVRVRLNDAGFAETPFGSEMTQHSNGNTTARVFSEDGVTTVSLTALG